MNVSGRKNEIKRIKKIVNSRKSEFVVIYGRRRVGKTFLIREYFNYTFDFNTVGMANVGTEDQLLNFHTSLNKQSHLQYEKIPNDWVEAFDRLSTFIDDIQGKQKKVIFFDELPWFDTHGSNFISALEHFWNSWATMRKDIVLITSGSAASWMINELINNTGGLHNRVTERIKILPFTLFETEEFFNHRGIVMDRFQIVQLYMALGGIPFYLEMIENGQSASQNLQKLFFDKTAKLKNEFFNLYRSLYKRHQQYEDVVEVLSKKTKGFTRSEIVDKLDKSSGGTLTKILRELEESGFIASYTSFDKKTKNKLYRLSDYYTAFYFKFIHSGEYSGNDAWIKLIDNPIQNAWQGFTFEQICIDHVEQIKNSLNIRGVYTQESSYRGNNEDRGVQIDLLIDRRDQVITICEAKFSINSFNISKDYATKLRDKIGIFKEITKTRKAVHLVMITTFGLVQNSYVGDIVQNEVCLDDLFVQLS